MEIDAGLSDQQRLINLLTKKGRGSFYRGWFRELDRGGALEVMFQHFCNHCGRLEFHGDVYALLGDDGDCQSLTIDELWLEAGETIYRFRDWIAEHFGCSLDAYNSMSGYAGDPLYPDAFVGACKHFGCTESDHDLYEIFNGLDIDFTGSLSCPEFIYLEKEKTVRDQARRVEKKRQKEKHLKLMAYVYFEDEKRGENPAHRRAPRAWHSQNFDQLPMLINRRRVEWQHQTYERSLEARITFVRHLRNTYGNEVRAWRIGLDPESHFQVDARVISRFCRINDMKVEAVALWRSLDKDDDGFFRLEDLSIRLADILATFRMWAIGQFGSVEGMWDCPEMDVARDKQQSQTNLQADKKILFASFKHVLKACDCAFVNNADMMASLLGSLDFHNCGFIERRDLQWLDLWDPPEWLCASPDPHAWSKMKELMLKKYETPLRAWRNLLDIDNSNSVSWVEFKDAAHRMHFRGNIGGAWRAANETLSSSICMKSYDPGSAQCLSSFKAWCEGSYGSVTKAFKALDEHGLGYVTFPELKRACQKLKYSGDVRLLFDCLDIDHKMHGGKKSISLKDVEFLDDWQGDRHPEETSEEFVIAQELAKKSSQLQPSTTLPALPPRLLQLTEKKTPKHIEHLPIGSDASSVNGLSDLASSPSRYSKAVTDCSNMSQKERLHRTYHCLSECSLSLGKKTPKGIQLSPSAAASLASAPLSPISPSKGLMADGKRPEIRKTQSLPWLHKLLAIDDQMLALEG